EPVHPGVDLEPQRQARGFGRALEKLDLRHIVHVDSGKENDFPLLNGTPIGANATRLNDNDVIQLAGVKMGFFVN
ncbi:MAG TPA: hypothetical protein VL176_03555, partial [Steroidobacteraceae bacterium]|nr:hypothetical protein [Steroidobacteraceae bacterium]